MFIEVPKLVVFFSCPCSSKLLGFYCFLLLVWYNVEIKVSVIGYLYYIKRREVWLFICGGHFVRIGSFHHHG